MLRSKSPQAQSAPTATGSDATSALPTDGVKDAPVTSGRSKRTKEAPAPKNRAKRMQPSTASGKSQRRMARLGLLLIVAIGGMSGGALILHRSTITTSVFIATKGIPAGAMIIPSDIGVEQVPLPGVPASLPLGQVLKSRASVTILPGEVLTKGLTTSQSVPQGQEVIGVSLTAGHIPAQGITAGTLVDIIYTSPQSLNQSAASSTGVTKILNANPGTVIGSAIVSSINPGANGGGTEVDLIVPISEVPLAATAAANNDITLARRS